MSAVQSLSGNLATLLRLVPSYQILALVGLAEVAGQILNHHEITRWTIRLGGLYALLMHTRSGGLALDDDVLGQIRDLETSLRCPFNRKLARLLALAFSQGFFILLTEAMPSQFDFDWSSKSHRCKPRKAPRCFHRNSSFCSKYIAHTGISLLFPYDVVHIRPYNYCHTQFLHHRFENM